MSSPHHGKGRYVVSDTDMLFALEMHVPSIRAIHSSINPLVRIVADWEPEELTRIDESLRKGPCRARKAMAEGFKKAAIMRSQAKKMDECEFDVKVDLYTVLEMNWGMHMLQRTITDIYTSYEVIYNALCARVSGRHPQAQELYDLHHAYGQLTQAKCKLTNKLQDLTGFLNRLADNHAALGYAVEAAIEAFSACTDVKEYLMLLRDAHHNGFEYARGSH